jgi:hypothetical protein
VLRRLWSSGLRRTRRTGWCGTWLWLPGGSVSRLAGGLTGPRLGIGFRARRCTGMELAAARTVRLQIVRHPVWGTMPMAVLVVESPLSAE